MMNASHFWMGTGGMWLWPILLTALVVLLVVAIVRIARK